ncbi:MAG: RNA polymerase [Dehalococcoidia bacterium]|nr:MAG: RNA polymerase [Dehalococcoidia bacterium]
MIDYQGADDEALVARLAEKDADALEALYDRHSRPVFSLALKMLGEVTAAEEVVQEVFLKLWRSPERFVAGRGKFRSWLLGVTHHRAVDELRSRRSDTSRRVAGDAEAETLRIPDGGPDPAEVAWLGVQHDIVQRALDTLPPEQREVIDLAYFKGLTHSEIAAALGEPLGTVKTRLRLAIQKLRSALETERLWAVKP